MKVIHFIGRYNQGGTAAWLNALIPGLRDRGIDASVYAGFTPNNENEDSGFKSLKGIRFKVEARSINPFGDFSAIFRFRKVLKSEKPDVLNTHTTKAGLIGRLAAINLPVRVVHTYHGHLLYGYFSKSNLAVYRFTEKILGKFTDNFIVVGDKIRDELIEVGIGKAGQFATIYPGMSNTKFTSRIESRNRYKLENSFVIGWLGRFTRIKRPDLLLAIAQEFPDITFLIGGSGELKDLFSNNSAKNIRLMNWVNPLDFWPACDLALLTSDNEGLPTSLVEAAMAGVPIVAPNVGAVSEVFENDKGGILVDSFSDYIKAIDSCYSGKIDLKKASINVEKFAVDRFSSEEFITRHINLYLS